MIFVGRAEPLTLGGLRDAANLIGVKAAVVLAVMDVETLGCGFIRDRRPVILYERHKFREFTHGAFDKVAPDLSSQLRGGYGLAGAHQYDRLGRAMALDVAAAVRATSWGLGQIMGFNSGKVGYSTIDEMISAFADGEDAQLMAVARYCVAVPAAAAALRRLDWLGFKNAYNGTGANPEYVPRLVHAYERHNRPHSIDLALRADQLRLMFAGLYHGKIDGIDGPQTQWALAEAARRGIEVTA